MEIEKKKTKTRPPHIEVNKVRKERREGGRVKDLQKKHQKKKKKKKRKKKTTTPQQVAVCFFNTMKRQHTEALKHWSVNISPPPTLSHPIFLYVLSRILIDAINGARRLRDALVTDPDGMIEKDVMRKAATKFMTRRGLGRPARVTLGRALLEVRHLAKERKGRTTHIFPHSHQQVHPYIKRRRIGSKNHAHAFYAGVSFRLGFDSALDANVRIKQRTERVHIGPRPLAVKARTRRRMARSPLLPHPPNLDVVMSPPPSPPRFEDRSDINALIWQNFCAQQVSGGGKGALV
jgi:hypothetical protein